MHNFSWQIVERFIHDIPNADYCKYVVFSFNIFLDVTYR
jgi:hypothetical protein